MVGERKTGQSYEMMVQTPVPRYLQLRAGPQRGAFLLGDLDGLDDAIPVAGKIQGDTGEGDGGDGNERHGWTG